VKRRTFLLGSLPLQAAAFDPGFRLVNVTASAGIDFRHNSGAYGAKYLPETLGAGCAFLDYDGDGWLDILLINGMDWPGHKRRSTTLQLYRNGVRRGFYPLLAVMLLSLPALPRSTTSMEFLFIWELITLSSYFLIVRRREAAPYALSYILFSLVSAFLLLAGFAMAFAVNGSTSLAALRVAGPGINVAFALLAIGLLIKAGAIGVHVWLPGAYAEADDDVSALPRPPPMTTASGSSMLISSARPKPINTCSTIVQMTKCAVTCMPCHTSSSVRMSA